MTDRAGWAASALVTALLFGGAAAAALRQPPGLAEGEEMSPVALDLSVGMVATPPPAMSAPEAPPQPAQPDAPTPPEAALPEPELPKPDLPKPDLPKPDLPPKADAAPLPDTTPLPDPAPAFVPPNLPRLPTPDLSAALAQVAPVTESPRPKSRPEPEKPKPEKVAKPKPEKPKPEKKTPAQASAAAPAGAVASPAQPSTKAKKAGGTDAASYAKTVMKKIARLKRKAAPAKGKTTVGFEIAGDGSLKRVVVLASSGSAPLDQIAQDHIRRAAPFPAPPEGAGRRFSFEFVAN